MNTPQKRFLITGAAGYIGSLLGERLAASFPVMGTDIRSREDLSFPVRILDVRDPALKELLVSEGITHVVHLASILEASDDRARDFDIDVNGTRNVLECCVGAGVKHLTVTSSGAAYGYHADNPDWIDEDQPLRGNAEFAYADHKRQIEQLLAQYRESHPELEQLIFRPGTVLGAETRNLITRLFSRKRVLAIRGSESPFVFIWDQDLLNAMVMGLEQDRTGIYNMAGDGALTMREIAALLDKPLLNLPVTVITNALRLGRLLRIGRYGPEQVKFLRYRPVLDNRRLKEDFGYQPEKTSAETFRFFMEHARARGDL